MRSPPEELCRDNTENPRIEIVTIDYYLQRTEVTRRPWSYVGGERYGGFSDGAVNNEIRHDAIIYCNRILVSSDRLFQIDRCAALGTIIGPSNYETDNFPGMGFYDNNGHLYPTVCNNNAKGSERRIEITVTGATTMIGPFPGRAEVSYLGIINH